MAQPITQVVWEDLLPNYGGPSIPLRITAKPSIDDETGEWVWWVVLEINFHRDSMGVPQWEEFSLDNKKHRRLQPFVEVSLIRHIVQSSVGNAADRAKELGMKTPWEEEEESKEE